MLILKCVSQWCNRITLVVLGFAVFSFGQSEKKFDFYGFSDFTITRYYPKDNSLSRITDGLDGKTSFDLSHVNLYGCFKPNNKIRFLTELSFQDKPVYYQNITGENIIVPQMGFDSTVTVAEITPKNKVQKGIAIYEWGSLSVERALMSVNFNRYLNLSFGKFVTPAGIWNVDHGSPVIVTVIQPAQYSYTEIFPKSQLGIMEEGKLFLGDADLAYSLYLSSGRDAGSFNEFTDLSAGGQLRLNFPVLDEATIGLSGYTGKVKKEISHLTMIRTYTSPTTYSTHNKFVYTDVVNYRENVVGGDVRFSKWKTAVQAEVNYQHIKDYLNKNNECNTIGTYVIGTYDLLKKDAVTLTPYVYFEYLKLLDPEQDPSRSLPMEGYKQFVTGLNMRLFTNYGVKLEYCYISLKSTDPATYYFRDFPGVSTQFYIAF